jgi:hypothetical protein
MDDLAEGLPVDARHDREETTCEMCFTTATEISPRLPGLKEARQKCAL